MQTLTCYNHPATPAASTCADCGASICATCTNMLAGQPFCPADYAIMRREPAGAHLPTEVPAYQPPQYQSPLPASPAPVIISDSPAASDSLFGSVLVTAAGAPLPGITSHPRAASPQDAIAKWAWVGLVCALLSIADVVAIIMLIQFHPSIPSWLGWMGLPMAYLVPGLAAASLIINIVTLLLAHRSNRGDRVETLGCTGLLLNGLILTGSAFVLWILLSIHIYL